MRREQGFGFLIVFLALIALSSTAVAQESKWELGARANVMLGDGKPANDMLGYGVIGRYYRSNGWFVGASLDYTAFDFEHMASLVGIVQDPAEKSIDADATNTILGGFLGRQYGDRERGFDWFWTAGIGVGFPEVDPVTGPVDGGGIFVITTDAGTEFHLTAGLGTSYHFSPTWSVALTGRLEHHFTDYTLKDSVSGATTTIDSQTPMGVSLGVNFKF